MPRRQVREKKKRREPARAAGRKTLPAHGRKTLHAQRPQLDRAERSYILALMSERKRPTSAPESPRSPNERAPERRVSRGEERTEGSPGTTPSSKKTAEISGNHCRRGADHSGSN